MKLKDNFFWKCYKRFYNNKEIPAPGNICNYFWKCVGGFFKYLLWDSPLIIFILISCLLVYKIIDLLQERSYLFLIIIPGICFVIFTTARFFVYLNSKFKHLGEILGLFLIFMVMIFVSSTIYQKEGESWQIIYLLYGFLQLLGILTFFIIGSFLVFSFTDEQGIFLKYIKSFKEKTCIMVERPDNDHNQDESQPPQTFSEHSL